MVGLSAALGFGAPTARGQDPDPAPLRLQGVVPAGVRHTATESAGTFEFTVVNTGPTPRDARVAVVYTGRPDVHYARDVWVPPRASVTTWVTVGPAPDQPVPNTREVRTVLYDRTGGGEAVVFPPGEEKTRSRLVAYQKRGPTTALLADPEPLDPGDPAVAPGDDTLLLARLLRLSLALSEHVAIVRAETLPPVAEGFDGIDVLVLAGRRLSADPPGRAAVRRWVEQGGHLWVRLDRTDSEVVAPILGDDFDITPVDRVGLTTLRLHRAGADPATAPPRDVEQPIDLVRVIPAGADRVLHGVNGWPASFVRPVGRGKVVFTTLGARGWQRPRGPRDGRSATSPDLPVGLPELGELASELHPQPARDPLPPESLGPLLAQEIGYEVVGRDTAAVVLGGFVLALLALGVGLRRSRRPELIGWLAPAAAVAVGAVFVWTGERARQAAPATSAVAEVVIPVPGSGEAAVSGLYAVYHPESGPAAIGTEDGATLDLDDAGLAGQIRRRVQADTDVWRWDKLSLPAGVRTGSFRATRTVGRVAALARFGPGGLEGRLESSAYTDPADAVILSPPGEPVGVRLERDGAFAARPEDVLPPGQFVTGAVLDDRQQRRQSIYRQLLAGPLPHHLRNRSFLLAWADPPAVPFTTGGTGRVVGTALLTVPLDYAPTPPDTRVVVPHGFIPARRLIDGKPNPLTMQGEASGSHMRLRFQLPPSVLPLTVERAALVIRARAPYRRVSVAGVAGGTPVPLADVVAPIDPIRVAVTDARLLQLDPAGGLLLDVAVGEPAGADAHAQAAWTIDSLSLEVAGRTGTRK